MANPFDFRDRPPAKANRRSLVDVVKASGAIDAAYGGPTTVPADPMDSVIDSVMSAFGGEKRQPTSIHRRLLAAANQRQAEASPVSRTSDETTDAKAAAKARLAELSPEELEALEDAYGARISEELNEAGARLAALGEPVAEYEENEYATDADLGEYLNDDDDDMSWMEVNQ